uniref:Dual specificity phosphatase 19 n=1 Tax=Naja naja TaxID=35670 RepID=A0A8C6XPE9_NAJNA
MHSLTQEIKSFSRTNLKKQCTRVTTLSGKRLIETWRDAQMQVVEVADCKEGDACGYVQDLSLDLQIGVIKPWLLLGSQDAAHDLEIMKKYKVTHVLNVAYGVENAFPNDLTYKTIPILDLPETDITSYFPQCFEFIEQIKLKGEVVLVHWFLMYSEGLNFAMAFSVVKNARPAICPNPGFMEQLQKYCQFSH